MNAVEIEALFKSTGESSGIGAGSAMQPLRLALSGEGGGPPIFEMLHLIGVEESIARINTAIQQIALTA